MLNILTAKILAVYNQKGGCGKTTTTVNLAAYAGINGIRTLVIDIDPQGSASRWIGRDAKDSFPADHVMMGEKDEDFDIKIETITKSGKYDLIIIDCPPAVNNQAAQIALMISDVVVVPAIPSPVDAHATDAGLSLINIIRRRSNPNMKVLQMNTRVARSNLAKSIISEIRKGAKSRGFIMLENGTADRSCYAESALLGKGVIQMKEDVPKKALEEVDAFCSEILTYTFED